MKVYDPAESYQPLVNEEASELELIDLLVDRVTPFLPSHVLEDSGRAHLRERVYSVVRSIRAEYTRCLRDEGFSRIAAKVRLQRDPVDVVEICRTIDDPARREEIRQCLSQTRDGQNAEFLEAFGFLPKTVFDRGTVNNGLQIPQGEMPGSHPMDERQHEQWVQFANLDELVIAALGEKGKSQPEAVVAELNIEQLRNFPRYARLAHWIQDANAEFDECVREAYKSLSGLFERSAPQGPSGQPYEQIGGLDTLSFAGLLETVLNKKLIIRRRLEAIRLLEWAIALFSIRRNPIYRAQQQVRRNIQERLRIEVWDAVGTIETFAMDPETVRSIEEEEHGDDVLSPFKDSRYEPKGRRLNTQFGVLFGDFIDILDRSGFGSVVYASREKDDFSGAVKVFSLQELVQKCQAVLDGMTSNIHTAYAKRKLLELKRRGLSLGKTPAELQLKPVSFDTIDDNVGFTLAVPLEKKLDDFTNQRQRRRVSRFFSSFGTMLAEKLGLEDVRLEDHLWGHDGSNIKSSQHFRIFKVHGSQSIESEVFVDGKLVKQIIKVPVEIQLHPIESHLRQLLNGPTSKKKYQERKGVDLRSRLHPLRIGEKEVYGDNKFDFELFAGALETDA